MICLCKKAWEYQTFSLGHNIYCNTVWNIKFIVPNSLVWAYKPQRNFCWYWKVKLIFQPVFPSLFLLLEWMQRPCLAWLQQKCSRDFVLAGWTCTAAQCLIIPLLSCSPAAPARVTGALTVLTQPQGSHLSPWEWGAPTPLHPHLLPQGVMELRGWYATHPYSRDTAATGGGRFILWISAILDFVLQYIYPEILQLWWQHWLGMLNCC